MKCDLCGCDARQIARDRAKIMGLPPHEALLCGKCAGRWKRMGHTRNRFEFRNISSRTGSECALVDANRVV